MLFYSSNDSRSILISFSFCSANSCNSLHFVYSACSSLLISIDLSLYFSSITFLTFSASPFIFSTAAESSSIRFSFYSLSNCNSLMIVLERAAWAAMASWKWASSFSLRTREFLMLFTYRILLQSTSLNWSSAYSSFFLKVMSQYYASSPNCADFSSLYIRSRYNSPYALAKDQESYLFCLVNSYIRDYRIAVLSAAAVRSCFCFSSRAADSEACLSTSYFKRSISWSRFALKFLNISSEQSENFFIKNSRPVCISSLYGHFLRQYSQNNQNYLTISPIDLNSPLFSLLSMFQNYFLMKLLVYCAFRTRIYYYTFSIRLPTTLAIYLRYIYAWSLLRVRLSKSRLSCSMMASCFSANYFLVVGRESINLEQAYSAYRSTPSNTASHYLWHTYFHPVCTYGTFLLLISLRYTLMSSHMRSALISFPLIFFVLILAPIILLKSSTCSVNSGRSWSMSKLSNFCSYCQLVSGLTKVKQLRLTNDARIMFLIRFLFSESPACAAREFQRYLLGVSGLLSLPTKASEKSLRIQQKSGKSLQSSERSCQQKRRTTPSESMAGSSMAPMVLQRKMELSSRVMLKSRKS